MSLLRLAITIAKIQQSLPEMKRDGNTVLGSLWADLMYSDKNTSRAGGVLPQVDFVPKLAKELQESPEKVIADFEEIRKYGEDILPVTCTMLNDPSYRPFWNTLLCHW